MRKLFRVVDVLVDADDFGATIIVLNQENFRYAASHLSPSFAVELFGKLGEPIAYYIEKTIKGLEEKMRAMENNIKRCEERLKETKEGFWFKQYTREKEETEKQLEKTKEIFNICVKLYQHAKTVHNLVNRLEELQH